MNPAADESRPGAAGSSPEPGARTRRREAVRNGLAGAALLAAGAAAGGGAVHYRDERLSPTARVAPETREAGLRTARVLFQGPSDRKRACLTFDDGPDARWTPLVLSLLKEAGIPATFFLLGSAVEAHPEIVKAEVAAGHEVGVHNWEHTDVYGVGIDALRGTVDRTIRAIEKAGAPRPALWRPPYGRIDAPALLVAAERDLDILLWSDHTPDVADAEAVATHSHPGSIVLCHDGRSEPSEAMLRAVVAAAVALKEKGYELVTGSEMLKASE